MNHLHHLFAFIQIPSRITILTIGFLALLSSTTFAQEARIITTNGEEFQGTIIQETPDTLFFRLESGIEFGVPRLTLQTIYYLAPPVDFWSFGATIGTPSGVNLVIARNFNRDWGLRLSGLMLYLANGVELDCVRRIGGGTDINHNLYLGVGTMAFKDPYYYDNEPSYSSRYIAGGYLLRWKSFQASLGLSVGNGNIWTPFPMIQIGYVHQYR